MDINWAPYKIPVVFTKMPKDELGIFHFSPNLKIEISDQLTGSLLSSTILHEVLEMISELHGLKLSESCIRTLEVALSQIMLANPDLMHRVFPEAPRMPQDRSEWSGEDGA
jgi:hypothetical protein